MQDEMEEIYLCCNFLLERIEKEMNILKEDFYTPKENESTNNEEYSNLLFSQFKRLLLNEHDPISIEENLYVIKRIIIIFKELKQFQNFQFNLESKDNIHYIKFYKELFNIINYITNLYPIDDYNYSLKEIYPSYINLKKLQELIATKNNNNKYDNLNNDFSIDIQPNEIMKMFRCFLLLILSRSFQYMYYTVNEFVQIFLSDRFRHDKYIGLIAQQKLSLLYDIVHRPPIIKIFSNNWYKYKFNNDEIYAFKRFRNIKDILNFGLFLKEINDNFIEFNEFYNLKFCLVYFFLLFTYDDFKFIEINSNKKNYPSFLIYMFKEILIEELFDEENIKKVNDTLSYKILKFIHGNNFCTIYPLIYFEKFFVDELAQKVNNDKVLNFPKDPTKYYLNRLKMYQNIKIIVESMKIKWEERNKLMEKIKEKIMKNLEFLEKFYKV